MRVRYKELDSQARISRSRPRITWPIADHARWILAHCEAIHVPGIWLQVHHVEVPYYERFFKNGLSESQRHHQDRWHST